MATDFGGLHGAGFSFEPPPRPSPPEGRQLPSRQEAIDMLSSMIDAVQDDRTGSMSDGDQTYQLPFHDARQEQRSSQQSNQPARSSTGSNQSRVPGSFPEESIPSNDIENVNVSRSRSDRSQKSSPSGTRRSLPSPIPESPMKAEGNNKGNDDDIAPDEMPRQMSFKPTISTSNNFGNEQRRSNNYVVTPLSPPPSPYSTRQKHDNLRYTHLRGKSSLGSSHNGEATKSYTDSESAGTPRTLNSTSHGHSTSLSTVSSIGRAQSPALRVDQPQQEPKRWVVEQVSQTFGPSKPENFSYPTQVAAKIAAQINGRKAGRKSFVMADPNATHSIPIFDIFGEKVIRGLFQDPAASKLFGEYANSRGHIRDVDFLERVSGYKRSMDELSTKLTGLSSRYVGQSAAVPLRLPLAVSKDLDTDVDSMSGAVMPIMAGLFNDARAAVEDRLAQAVYHDFLCQQTISALHDAVNAQGVGVYLLSSGFSGFGEALCITDASKQNNPISYISESVSKVTQHDSADLFGQNLRLLQGPGTNDKHMQEIRRAVSMNEECCKLVLNYRKEGTLFWNLIWIVPLIERDGSVKYWLGGQLDVTSLLTIERDIVQLLGTKSATTQPPTGGELADDGGRRSRRDTEDTQASQRRGRSRSRSMSRIRNGFKSFWSRSSKVRDNETSKPDDTEGLPWPATPTNMPDHVCAKRSTDRLDSFPLLPSFNSLTPYPLWFVAEIIPSQRRNSSSIRSAQSHIREGLFNLKLAYWSKSTPSDVFELCEGEIRHQSASGQSVFDMLPNVGVSTSTDKKLRSQVQDAIAKGDIARVDIELDAARSRSRSRSRARSKSSTRRKPRDTTPPPPPSGLMKTPSTSASLNGSSFASNGTNESYSTQTTISALRSPPSTQSLNGSAKKRGPPVSLNREAIAAAETHSPQPSMTSSVQSRQSVKKSLSIERLRGGVESRGRAGRDPARTYTSTWAPLKGEDGVPKYVVVTLIAKGGKL